MTRPRLLAVVALGWGLLALPWAGLPASATHEAIPTAAGAARFTGSTAFEPTLGITSGGAIFFSSFDGSLLFPNLVRRSLDNGLTWVDTTPKVAGVKVTPATFDPYVYVDTATGRVFVADLQALACSTLSFSDDLGATWIFNPLGCGQPPGVHDHQNVWSANPRILPTVAYSKVVYYCVNRVVDTACATSLNGGLTFGPLRPLVYQGVATPEGLLCSGLMHHGEAHPNGTVYLPAKSCSVAPAIGFARVAISMDDGLTWTRVAIDNTVPVFDNDVAFAVDEGGNAYALWISQANRHAFLAVSTDGGWTWGAPIDVTAPGVQTTSFMSVAGGASGRIAFMYYGTPNAPNNLGGAAWNGYIGLSTDATAASPTFQYVTVRSNIATGDCDGINRCNNVGDFLDIVIDNVGRPWGAFIDSNDAGRPAFVGTLSVGPTLRGHLGPLPAL